MRYVDGVWFAVEVVVFCYDYAVSLFGDFEDVSVWESVGYVSPDRYYSESSFLEAVVDVVWYVGVEEKAWFSPLVFLHLIY